MEEGAITPERLDESVKRILSAKMEYGLFDDPMPYSSDLSHLASRESLDLARRIARESITLVRDSEDLIPLQTEQKITLIWPAELDGSIAPLLEGCPFLEPHLLSLGATAAETGEFLQLPDRSTPLIVGTYNLQRYPAWSAMVGSLAEERDVVLLALASPYDILAAPHIGACLCTYSDSRSSMEALAAVLKGALAPKGRLPVELPGIE